MECFIKFNERAPSLRCVPVRLVDPHLLLLSSPAPNRVAVDGVLIRMQGNALDARPIFFVGQAACFAIRDACAIKLGGPKWA